jgi:hypothetical protein
MGQNDVLIESLRSYYPQRNEPNFAWKSAVSCYLQLPVLRGFWPMSGSSSAGSAVDMSHIGLNLTANGAFVYTCGGGDSIGPGTNGRQFGLAPAVNLEATSAWLSFANNANLDITGLDGFVTPSLRGLTLGCWIWIYPVTPGNFLGAVAKANFAGNQFSYALGMGAAGATASFLVSATGNPGTSLVAVNSPGALPQEQWVFLAARFDPSTESAIWVDKEKTVNTTAIPASIFNSTAPFTVGRMESTGRALPAFYSNVFLCAAAVPDFTINALYEQTKAMYGHG